MKSRLKIFSFGYWGWGNATRELVKATSAVEKGRGFKPPYFVDIRIHRQVRAAGFHDEHFEQLVGSRRHRWMPELGNLSVLPKHRSSKIRIKSPAAAADLLELARDRARDRQRVIFFCSCEFPCSCHRYVVGRLLLETARSKKVPLEVVEWPGDDPITVDLDLRNEPPFKDSASRLYLPQRSGLAKFAGLPAGSLVNTHGPRGRRTVAVAPAMYAPTGWYLPLLKDLQGEPIPGTRRAAHAWRKECGHLPRQTV